MLTNLPVNLTVLFSVPDCILPAGKSKGGITDQLDKMLEEAKIDSQLLERLGDGMRSLGENAAQLKSVSSAAAATDSYVSSLQAASDKVSNLSEAYERASVSISGMTSEAKEGESFAFVLQKIHLQQLMKSYLKLKQKLFRRPQKDWILYLMLLVSLIRKNL